VNTTTRPLPIGALLAQLASAEPDRPMLTVASTTVSRRELESQSNRLAREFERLGVNQGDLVTIALPNSIEFVLACFATWKLGAVPQPVSHHLPDHERQAIVELANSALVVGATPGSHGHRVVVESGTLPVPSTSDAPIVPHRTSPALKAPTSGGSTGRPKLIIAGADSKVDPNAGLAFGMKPNGVQLAPGPLYHNGPLTFLVSGMALGNHVVLMERFSAELALEAITVHGVDWLNVVPTMMRRMAVCVDEQPERFDLSSIRFLWHMAAPCPIDVKRWWIDAIGPDRVMELYSATESQAATAISGVEWLDRPGSVGRAVIGSLQILDESGHSVPPGQIGEVYMQRPDGAPPTYRYVGAEVRARGAWESVGDLGYLDEDGYLFLQDRRDDLIISGGANIYPAEVEAALEACDGVVAAVVVGLPDDDLGQRVHAVVEAATPLTTESLLAEISERLVKYKLPRSVAFVDGPLRDDAGKTRRSRWREIEADRWRTA
jgi:bile acid-coenzyme A ligase